MASLQFLNLKPRENISERTTSAAIHKTLEQIYSEIKKGLWLVGGTAISAYYAEHRRSEDLDLFTDNPLTLKQAVLGLRALKNKGAQLLNESTSPHYYHTNISFMDHSYTVDIVVDENLHKIGKAYQTNDGVWVADLPTLFAMKVATLVSRCSEKDLFDLDWLIGQLQNFDIAKMIRKGASIDTGLNVETLLISLQGAILRKEACHFLLEDSEITVDQAYKKILNLRKFLIKSLLEFEKKLPPSNDVQALKAEIKTQKQLKKEI